MGCLNGKNSNSYCSSEANNRPDKKSTPSSQKKFGQRLEDFAHIFGKLTTPYGMFEWQKTHILIAHQKERIGRTKKVPLAAKKNRLETGGFCTYFLLFNTPYVMFGWKRNSNYYCSSEEKNRPDKKSTASSQKKFGQRLEDFAHIFCC